jgi:diaminohydroxyphosphoribosylaminopyrimidine deaminase/5-amino-6-(5-phosphoribosylamino)uracil reductase
VVLDSHLRLPVSSRLVHSAQDDLLVFCAAENISRQKELESRGVRVEPLPPQGAESGRIGDPVPPQHARRRRVLGTLFGAADTVDLSRAIGRLGELQMTSLLVEGGSSIHGALLRAHLADKVFLYYAPWLFGSEGVPLASGTAFGCAESAPRVRNLTWHQLGEDFAVEGYLRDPYS